MRQIIIWRFHRDSYEVTISLIWRVFEFPSFVLKGSSNLVSMNTMEEHTIRTLCLNSDASLIEAFERFYRSRDKWVDSLLYFLVCTLLHILCAWDFFKNIRHIRKRLIIPMEKFLLPFLRVHGVYLLHLGDLGHWLLRFQIGEPRRRIRDSEHHGQ